MAKWIQLREGVSACNMFAFLLAAALSISFLVFLNASQPFVLAQALAVPAETLGSASGALVFYDELLALAATPLWGAASDATGRRAVYAAGYAIIACALVCYPFAPSYGVLVALRLLFAAGAAAVTTMLPAVLSDVADSRDRGKLAGVLGLATGCGALIGLFGFIRIPAAFDASIVGLRHAYFIVAAVALATAVCLAFALPKSSPPAQNESIQVSEETPPQNDARATTGSPNPSTHLLTSTSANDLSSTDSEIVAENNPSTNSASNSPTNPSKIDISKCPAITNKMLRTRSALFDRFKIATDSLKRGFRACRNPRILLGLVGSFLARGDTITITLFIPLHVYKFYLVNGTCRGSLEDDIHSCREAYVLASILSGLTQTFALIAAPFFGILADKINRPLAIAFSGLLASVGYAMLASVEDPTHPINYAATFFVGVGEVGMIVLALTLVTPSSLEPEERGGVAGISSFCGAAGILLVSSLGGYMFDNLSNAAPFALVAGAQWLAIIVAIAVMIVESRKLGIGNTSELVASVQGIEAIQS